MVSFLMKVVKLNPAAVRKPKSNLCSINFFVLLFLVDRSVTQHQGIIQLIFKSSASQFS